MATVKKTLVTLGFICGFAAFILHAIERTGLLSIPAVFILPLLSAFCVSSGITQSNKVFAKLFYFIAAGYGLLTLAMIFF